MLPAFAPAHAVLSARSATDAAGGDARPDAKAKITIKPKALALLGIGNVSTRNVTISEKGYKGTFTEKSTCKRVASVKPASGKGPLLKVKFTAKKAGACAIVFSDANKNKATLKVTDTTAAFAISASSISPGSVSIAIVLTSVNGKKPPTGIHRSAVVNLPSCAGGCTVAGPQSPAGTDVYALTIFDAKSGGGNQLATARASFKVVAAKNNHIAASLAKIVKSLSFGAAPSAAAGAARTQTLPLTAQDADHNVIAGSYASPVTVSDSDTSAQGSALSVNSGTGAPSVQLTGSSDALSLVYGGLAISPATIAASATGATSASALFTPTLNAIAYICNGGGSSDTTECSATPREVDLYGASGTGSSASFTLSELGWSNSPYNKWFSESDACSSIATVTTTDHSTFTARVVTSPTVGNCIATLKDGVGQQATVTLTYATSSIGVNAKHASKPRKANRP